MSKNKERKPTHPGQLFKEILEENKTTISSAALLLGVSRKHLSAFINERVPCSKDLAKRMAIATDTSVGSWLNMQATIDIWEADHDDSEQYLAVGRLKNNNGY